MVQVLTFVTGCFLIEASGWYHLSNGYKMIAEPSLYNAEVH